MTNRKEIPFSILDLSWIREGEGPGEALRDTLDLAQHAEQWGYHRLWLAEHHGMPGIASAATSVALAYVAGGTSTIRLGSGGIMLPNHAPLLIAEQFGTLASLYPGRIDLGLGRAPGSDGFTMRALRQDLRSSADDFPEDVAELQMFLGPERPGQLVRAVPGQGTNVPIYLLGSSDYTARLAAQMGLPFAFASHFAPAFLHDALDIYRREFRPSDVLDKPYAMVAGTVVAADDEEEARRLFTSAQMGFLNLFRGTRAKLQPPVDAIDELWSSEEKAKVDAMLRYSFVGTPAAVKKGIEGFLGDTDADELIVTSRIYSQAARLRSFELLADIHREMFEKVGASID